MLARSLVALALVVPACDNGAAAPAKQAQTFGTGVSLTETVAVDRILAEPVAFQGKTVRVEGTVTDVCPRRGCWFEIAGAKPGAKLRFKVTDGQMVFPVDSKGRHAVAQGQVAVTELSLEDSRAYAEEQAKEFGRPFDPASVTKPMQLIRARPVLFEVNTLHLNNLKGAWTYVADVFAIALMVLALTGMTMMKGNRGLAGRGKYFVGAGLLVPVGFIVYLYA